MLAFNAWLTIFGLRVCLLDRLGRAIRPPRSVGGDGMEVSHFELLFKPQSPKSVEGAGGSIGVDSVIQGYFLKITNLEDQTYQYSLDFIATPPPEGTEDRALRSLAGNTLTFVDTPGQDNESGFLDGDIDDSEFRLSTGRVVVPARGTALVAVLPEAFGPNASDLLVDDLPAFEVRGYVRITLPTVITLTGARGAFPIREVAQSENPVKVLLTPQNRSTYFTAEGAISDQTQATLPLCDGKACVELTPQTPLVVPDINIFDNLERLSPAGQEFFKRKLTRAIERMPEGGDMAMLVMLLGKLDPKNRNLKKINEMLAESGSKVKLDTK